MSGLYQPLSGKTSCKQCPKGYAQSDEGSSYCPSCNAGLYSNVQESSICKECTKGRYQHDSSTFTCLECPLGYAQPDKGFSYCASCSPGTYSNVVASSLCIECEIGKYMADSGSENKCKECSIGRFIAVVRGVSCELCLAGKYNDELGIDASDGCKQCPIGTYSIILGGGALSSTCSNCGKGKFSNEKGSSICKECLINQYQPQESSPSSKCLNCPDGWQQLNPGQSFCSDLGYLKPSNCKDEEYLNDTETDRTKHSCVNCLVGASCKGDVALSGIVAKFGWSQCSKSGIRNSSVKKFARCMFAPACLGGTNTALLGKFKINNDTNDLAQCNDENCTAQCNLLAGYATGSRLCGQCAPNFSQVGLTGQCNACPPPGQNIVVGIVGVVAGLVGLVVFIQITLHDGGNSDESDGAKLIGLSFIQLISLLVTFPIAWPPIFVAIFQVGGAITVLGQHFVNLKW